MKYANQINLVLAVAGVLVALYALSATFLAPSPRVTLNVEQLAQEGAARVGNRVPQTDVSPVLRNSTTTARGSIAGGRSFPSDEASPSGVVGVPGGTRRPTPSVANRSPLAGARPLPSSRSVRIGSRPDTSPGSRAASAEPGPMNPNDDAPSFDPTRPPQVRQRPPAGAEAAKRGMSDSGTPTPPTRSSVPVQQRRP